MKAQPSTLHPLETDPSFSLVSRRDFKHQKDRERERGHVVITGRVAFPGGSRGQRSKLLNEQV